MHFPQRWAASLHPAHQLIGVLDLPVPVLGISVPPRGSFSTVFSCRHLCAHSSGSCSVMPIGQFHSREGEDDNLPHNCYCTRVSFFGSVGKEIGDDEKTVRAFLHRLGKSKLDFIKFRSCNSVLTKRCERKKWLGAKAARDWASKRGVVGFQNLRRFQPGDGEGQYLGR